MTKCLRCGQCCYLAIDGKVSDRACPYLVPATGNLGSQAKCIIYHSNKRIGGSIGYGNVCLKREDSPFDFPGCPYNTNKPIGR